MKKIILFFTLFASLTTYAQNTGSLVGKLIDLDSNNEPLIFANILIKGTIKGTTSDFDGLYSINGIEPGIHTVIYSFVGYETQEIKVEIFENKDTELNVSMKASAASLDEIVITTSTKRESETALLLEQKKAVEIKQSIGAEELSRKGVSDAAGAVAKISGVSKQEGSSNVYVRGLGDRYLNTTMNELSLPSNDVNKKNIDLNIFSSDIIENVSISKAYTTNFYGDFAAGNVNINSKDYSGNWFFDAFTATGFNTNAIDKDFVRSEGTGYFGYYGRYDHNPFAVILSHGVDPVSVDTPINFNYGASTGKSFTFKNDSKLSVFATASFGNNYEYRKGSAVDYTLTEKKAFDNNAEEYEYNTTTTAMASVNYRIDYDNSIKYNFLFINNSSDVVGYFGIDGKGRNRDAQVNTDEGFYQMNVQFDQTQMYVNQLLGNHTSGKFDIDWGFGYNYVFSKQPDRKRISLENYQYALDNDSDTNPIFYSNVVFDNQRYFQNIEDEEYNGRVNLAYNLNDNLKLNFGFNGRSKQRDFENIRYGYDIVDSNYQITNVNNFNSVFTLDNLNLNPEDNGVYEIKVINNIPGLSNTNRPGLPENTYEGKLDIFAGYADAEITFGEKWLILPGIRLESFQQDISFDVINLGNQGKNSLSSYKNFFLPSLNVKYTLNDNQNLRFSASQTVSIPEFKEVAPFVYEDISTKIGGNPDLLDIGYSKIFNIDLKYEWFYTKSEIISVALFTKQINDPINLVVGADATGTQRYFRTGDKANVYGIEVEVRKNILSDEENDSKLSVGFNATYMKTKQDLYSSIDGEYYDVSFEKSEDELQGASPLILNADINYSPTFGNYKPVANLIFSYFSDRIDALGSGQLGNVIEKGVPTLDFIWKNNIGENLEVNISIKNLLNPTIEYFRETTLGDISINSANGKGVTDYKRGMDLGLQLKYKF
ncbi:TonB-dependent receptor [Formosa maritima]|uniref:TonB-dependent receptor plug domain-containing protein n=1 Tax=Formosa maritima TaxID=2592046 RepID=A0A5D0G2X7_9FLAO|nr:TonB-dependent receptor [Formosa maritima]TYA52422.1 TonB-dependent receptor plug domain-containing protein [Formosa maritima]